MSVIPSSWNRVSTVPTSRPGCGTFGADQVLATVYDDLRDEPQSYLDSVTDFIGIPRFELAPAQIGRVFTSETMTHPRNYYRTRSAFAMAEWLKLRQLDTVVAAVKKSPLLKFVLGGGPPFTKLSGGSLAEAL